MTTNLDRLEWLRYGAVVIALGGILWAMASWQGEAQANDNALAKEQKRHCEFIGEQRKLNSRQAVMHAEMMAWMKSLDEKMDALLERGE